MNVQTATPAQIDTVLAPIATRRADAHSSAYELRRSARKAHRAEQAARYEAQAAAQDVIAAAAHAEAAPLEAEFRARGGWTRVFWCASNGGHAHRTLSCQTLRITTPMVWLPEHSGATESEIVALAGDSACTYCYPTAPVATAAPSQLRPAREAREAKEARDADLAAARAAKDAKAIRNPDGSQLRGRYGVVNTVVSAWKEAGDGQVNHQAYGYAIDAKEAEAEARIVEALAVKLGRSEESIREELAEKVAKRVKRAKAEIAKYNRTA